MTKHIIIDGNPVDGFTFTGPYDSMDDAIAAGEANRGIEWWVAPLDEPEVSETRMWGLTWQVNSRTPATSPASGHG